ncbi:hypothetical protein [Candidatus Odyssella thessalonicensis]|uniref:hypothetical protein n=1 Tax=Candidatus Odyssella thessalonicensis TaxID=84647 RepID=UPI000225BD99|nr:hypothetical protein [Candidatus Odyssella thessalonicensis]
MEVFKILFMCSPWAMISPDNEVHDPDRLTLLDLPTEILASIAASSDADAKLALRETCFLTKACVDDFYLLNLKKNFCQ